MFINKIGYEHIEKGLNCQDFGFEYGNIKCVMDGCSASKHSEVGVKLFSHLFSKGLNIYECFNKLLEIFPDYHDIENHLLFTVLCVSENDDEYVVDICGDGYIIKQKYDNSIEYEKIGEGNTPPYFAYNFVPQSRLPKYKDGVVFERHIFTKSEYKAIGVASDGLEYILNSPFKEEFEQLLIRRKEFPIRRLINREQKYIEDGIVKYFSDDISIVIWGERNEYKC